MHILLENEQAPKTYDISVESTMEINWSIFNGEYSYNEESTLWIIDAIDEFQGIIPWSRFWKYFEVYKLFQLHNFTTTITQLSYKK